MNIISIKPELFSFFVNTVHSICSVQCTTVPNNNLNLHIKTPPVTVGADASVLHGIWARYVCKYKLDLYCCIRFEWAEQVLFLHFSAGMLLLVSLTLAVLTNFLT